MVRIVRNIGASHAFPYSTGPSGKHRDDVSKVLKGRQKSCNAGVASLNAAMKAVLVNEFACGFTTTTVSTTTTTTTTIHHSHDHHHHNHYHHHHDNHHHKPRHNNHHDHHHHHHHHDHHSQPRPPQPRPPPPPRPRPRRRRRRPPRRLPRRLQHCCLEHSNVLMFRGSGRSSQPAPKIAPKCPQRSVQ